ncbi:MAG TPA: methylaspartate mutase subunit S [Casimicrobiaceae bacterium]|nr:methylaspartate mutase subunit S [Casimicrobiaceae bacterium]
MPQARTRKPRVVIGVIGDDIHVVGNRIMQLALEESGCAVFNLRTRNRPDHFCQAALEVNADAIFVSSLNGEGEYWCADFRDRLHAMELGHVLLYAGGNLVVGDRPEAEVVKQFKSFGFDRVYHRRPDIGAAIADLFEDLAHGDAQRQRQVA